MRVCGEGIMDVHEIKWYHLWYNIAIILIFVLLDKVILNYPKVTLTDFLFYFIVMIFTPILIFGIFVLSVLVFNVSMPKEPYGIGDIYLSTSAIATVFLIDDLIILLKNPLYILISIIITYFVIHTILSEINIIKYYMNS